MGKRIQCLPEDVESILSQIRQQLETGKSTQGTYTIDFAKPDTRKVNLNIAQLAWSKMIALVAEFDGEVGWHGLVRRTAPDSFEIYDILVYPHEVTGATITADQAKYEAWLDTLDDTTFAALRFHGHSHVDFGVTPSGTDNEVRRKKLGEFPRNAAEDQFYIFMIINKKWEWSATVFDLSDNTLYETHDINLSIAMGDTTLAAFLAQARTLATKKTYTAPSYGTGGWKGNYGYDDDYAYGYKGGYSQKSPPNAAANKDDGKDVPKLPAPGYWNGNEYLDRDGD